MKNEHAYAVLLPFAARCSFESFFMNIYTPVGHLPRSVNQAIVVLYAAGRTHVKYFVLFSGGVSVSGLTAHNKRLGIVPASYACFGIVAYHVFLEPRLFHVSCGLKWLITVRSCVLSAIVDVEKERRPSGYACKPTLSSFIFLTLTPWLSFVRRLTAVCSLT